MKTLADKLPKRGQTIELALDLDDELREVIVDLAQENDPTTHRKLIGDDIRLRQNAWDTLRASTVRAWIREMPRNAYEGEPIEEEFFRLVKLLHARPGPALKGEIHASK